MSAGSFTSGVSAACPPLVHPRLHLAKGPLSESIAASGLPVRLDIVEVTSMSRRGCHDPIGALSMLLGLTAIRRLTYVDLSVLPVSSPRGRCSSGVSPLPSEEPALPPPSNCPQCCHTSSASPLSKQPCSLECPVQHPYVLTAHLLLLRPLTGLPSTDVKRIQCSRRSDGECVVGLGLPVCVRNLWLTRSLWLSIVSI